MLSKRWTATRAVMARRFYRVWKSTDVHGQQFHHCMIWHNDVGGGMYVEGHGSTLEAACLAALDEARAATDAANADEVAS